MMFSLLPVSAAAADKDVELKAYDEIRIYLDAETEKDLIIWKASCQSRSVSSAPNIWVVTPTVVRI